MNKTELFINSLTISEGVRIMKSGKTNLGVSQVIFERGGETSMIRMIERGTTLQVILFNQESNTWAGQIIVSGRPKFMFRSSEGDHAVGLLDDIIREVADNVGITPSTSNTYTVVDTAAVLKRFVG